ncbi:hypothetical protein B0H13DRAFT_1906234 [Mycena leptocephala]|nr:hypothetical protein B0H13DRAFT_1906234 [Mycena leptocephala]
MDARRRFKCCSTCQSADYCLKSCQAADWRDGHRDVRKKLRAFRLRERSSFQFIPLLRTAKEHPDTLSTRGKCFLRELLSNGYFRHLNPISIQHVEFMYEHPGEAFFTAFAYSDAGDIQVKVQPTAKLKMAGAWDAGMSTEFSRAEKSGRTDIHLMLLFEGQRHRRMVFSMRTDSSRLQNGLVQISPELPSGKRGDEVLPQIRERVEALLAEVEPEMILIH